jgi:hypothetical protein
MTFTGGPNSRDAFDPFFLAHSGQFCAPVRAYQNDYCERDHWKRDAPPSGERRYYPGVPFTRRPYAKLLLSEW